MKTQLVLGKTYFGRGLSIKNCIGAVFMSEHRVVGRVESIQEMEGVYLVNIQLYTKVIKEMKEEGE